MEGRATDAETAEYVSLRLGDYGPEELVHDGVLLLNDDLRAARSDGATTAPSRDRFEAWAQEAASFDADPLRWNRRWAVSYLEGVLPRIKPASRRRVLEALADKLDERDVLEIAERFHVP